jgi:hypothetical protein
MPQRRQRPPIIPPGYTPAQAALIAGFLIHHRAGLLTAMQTLGEPEADSAPAWADPVRAYWTNAEQYSRFLLWAIGYPVGRDVNYVPPED